jgi:hypothetical protein
METSTLKKKCTRCGKEGWLCSNGLCPRCDDVAYGKKVMPDE